MKHIKKKYSYQEKITKELDNKIETKGEKVDAQSKGFLKKSKEKDLFIRTDEDYLIKAFAYKKGSELALIPIPDLSLVYFDSAYNLNELRKEKEIEFFTKRIVKEGKLGEDATNEIYRYYGYASSCVISMFTAMECFVNFILPEDKQYVKTIPKRRTEYYTKEQIQKVIPFDEKKNKVLPYFFDGKSFFKNQTKHTQHLNNLKELRNEIVHPKSEDSFRKQEKLIRKLIDFKYDETFDALAIFMNFYKKEFVIECDCGIDY
jgi:hypothetical protein